MALFCAAIRKDSVSGLILVAITYFPQNFFYVVFESSYRYIITTFNADKSLSFFSWHLDQKQTYLGSKSQKKKN